MLEYRGRKLDIDDKLLEEYKHYFGQDIPEWRIDLYLNNRYAKEALDLSLLNSLSDEGLTEIVRHGIETEIKYMAL